MSNAPIKCLHSEVWPLERFIENPHNPNRHPEGQIALLAQILSRGWRTAIVVSRRSGFVVKGHGRLAAARRAGFTEAPVHLQDYATEAEEWADMVADNRLAELSERDNDAVLALVNEIQDTSDLEVAMAGFTEVEVQAMALAAPRDESDHETIAPPDGQSSSGVTSRVLRFGKESFPLSDEEYAELVTRGEAFKKRTGTTYGFVTKLLNLST